MHTKQAGDIPASLIVWAAGVCGHGFMKNIGDLETNVRNQILVRDTLQTTIDERIFALGDCCSHIDKRTEVQTPPRAQAAQQMARTISANVDCLIRGRPLVGYTYKDHGSLVSLSRYSTVGSLMGNLVGGRMAIEGKFARIVYVTLYRMHLLAIHGWLKGIALIAIGYVNRIIRPRLKLH